MSARQANGPSSGEVVGLLDIGTSKVCCIIVRLGSAGRRTESGATGSSDRVIGLGYHRSRGVKAGVIVDMDEAEQAVRSAVAQAERMAGTTVERIILAVDCGRIRSHAFTASADVQGGLVSEHDIARVMAAANDYASRDGRLVLQLDRLDYQLDGQGGIRDVTGMAGRQLAVEVVSVTADDAPLRNVVQLIERCHLQVDALVPAGIASALASTTEDERRVGITAIDIGGGTTSITAFVDGKLVFTETLPVGGNHVTYDVARGLQTPLAEAERIKALYGTVARAASDERETFSYPLVGRGDADGELEQHQASRAHVRLIIEPRMEIILGLVRERLEAFPGLRLDRSRAALTGGASQLVGLGEFAANRLAMPVKIGKPASWGGVPGSVCTPAYSTVLGLLQAASRQDQRGSQGMGRGLNGSGYLSRVGRWLKESF